MKISSPPARTAAFTRLEALALLVTLALLTVVLLPSFAQESNAQRARRIGCVSNLKQIGLAFRIWSNDHADKFPAALPAERKGTMELIAGGKVLPQFLAISNELGRSRILTCPADTRASVTNFADLTAANLSYFVGLDADEAKPQTLLSGDRNFSVNGAAAKPGLLALQAKDELGWTKELHVEQGNIGLGDGSVQQVMPERLQRQFEAMQMEKYRVVVP